jgi:hypothetical protein
VSVPEPYVIRLTWAGKPTGRLVFEFTDKSQLRGEISEFEFDPELAEVGQAIREYLRSGFAVLTGGLMTNRPEKSLDGVLDAIWKLREEYSPDLGGS